MTPPPPLSEKCPHWLNHSPLSVRTHHKFRKMRSYLCQKLRTSTPEESLISALDKPPFTYLLKKNITYLLPLIADVFYGQTRVKKVETNRYIK